MYYGLSNFYQNHRRYVKSRDDSQLNGDKSSLQVSGSRICLMTDKTGGKDFLAFSLVLNALHFVV